ncbi:hypothetical protein ACQCN2_20085 [Brevibacillus ginsengisoli]|uniref:hypothetical protein n=1 Tax=Brevibacillus ginsengisoli TaxID=363854 RepID=UPI003CFA2226
MTYTLPLFLIVLGVVVIWQPRTKRWQERIRTHLAGNEQRVKQRANTFFLLGFAFILCGISLLYRISMQ